MNASRRTVLKFMGLQLALPLVPELALAQGMPSRRRFIAGYTPNGAHMPMGADGSWNWNEALQPLVARGHQPNTMILRKLFNGFPGADPHWQNCAGFLSCEPIVLGDVMDALDDRLPTGAEPRDHQCCPRPQVRRFDDGPF